MPPLFQEIDYQVTEIGALSLRRRWDFALEAEVWEIKLGEEFLMTSAFTASEIALARAGLAACRPAATEGLTVVVGGLGLGYTAQAVLEDPRVGRLTVVDRLAPVIAWHEDGILPLGPALTADPRCRFVKGDFFALARGTAGFDPERPGTAVDALLVDIDHAPDTLLAGDSAGFYQPAGLAAAARHLRPGGVFGLWSNDAPDAAFTERLAGVFAEAWAEPVTFPNPLQGRDVTQTVYLGRVGGEA